MKISMASIYKKFEKEQSILRKQYQLAGMNNEQILEMYEFDKKQLARDIAYYRRTQNIEVIHSELNSDSNNKLLNKFLPMLSIGSRNLNSLFYKGSEMPFFIFLHFFSKSA